MADKARFGSAFCYVEGTPDEVFQYRLWHSEYCRKALQELVPVTPLPLSCRFGFHAMKTRREKDGGGHKFRWGHCTRCNGSFAEGWAFPADYNNLKRYMP